MNILVTGGAGYIGSVTASRLAKKNTVIILDNLCKGHKTAVKDSCILIEGDIADENLVKKIIKEHAIDAVVHFAAFIEVGESEENPLKYFDNNVHKSVKLLKAVIDSGVKMMVYSSSAAVYGEPKKYPIDEEDKKEPTNVYGLTKLVFEKILEEYSKNQEFKAVALRYFNAAGADNDNDLGEDHHPESHLIPIILQTALGKRKNINIFGTDYETKDGSCLRDFVHVIDLANAHILALQHLTKTNEGFTPINIGSGNGYTVKEVIESARNITQKEIVAIETERRKGDPAVLLASNKKAKNIIGWEPTRDIKQILSDAWQWHNKHPKGYE